MIKTENSAELDNQELATVSGGATAPSRRTLDVTDKPRNLPRIDLSKVDISKLASGFQLQPVELPSTSARSASDGTRAAAPQSLQPQATCALRKNAVASKGGAESQCGSPSPAGR